MKECIVADCARRAAKRGYCNAHYIRLRRHGDPTGGAEYRKHTSQPCSVSGCPDPRDGDGYCSRHGYKWRRYGDPLAGRTRHADPEAAFAARTERLDGCLVWTGATDEDGYGSMWVASRNTRPHRYAWEQANGPIPVGMTIDHKCWNRACCEVSHLRLATRHENRRNLSGATSRSQTGVRNVFPLKSGRFITIVRRGDETRYSSHDTIEQAAHAASIARTELFGEFAGRG